VIFALMLSWSLASPTPSGPDEPTQFIKAAAVAHGTLIGTPVPHSTSLVGVRVAGTYINAASVAQSCVYHTPATSGGCAPPLVGSSAPAVAFTYVGRYPPLYYAIVGLPSLVSSAPWTLHGMRAMSALLNAVALGLAFAATRVWARSVAVAIAATLAVTPMAIYLGSVVNPNSLEVSAAIAAWVTGAILVFDRSDDPPPGLVGAFAVASVLLCASRTLSTVWWALIVMALVALRPASCGQLARRTAVRVGVGVSLVAAVVSGIYVVVARSYAFESFPLPPGTTTIQILAAIAGDTGKFVDGTIGIYGSPDTKVPLLVVGIWVVGVGALFVGAVALAARRDAWLLAAIAAVYVFVIPFAVIYSHAATNGITWQGRYGYPISVGVPVLAGALIGQRYTVPSRLMGVSAAAVVVGNLAAFYWLLRRYVVGMSRIDPFREVAGAWRLPLALPGLVALTVIATVAYGILVVVCARTRAPLATAAPAPTARGRVSPTAR